jgi:hypothetical protein
MIKSKIRIKILPRLEDAPQRLARDLRANQASAQNRRAQNGDLEVKMRGNWLPDMDLNHDKQIQSLLCYRYTIGQAGPGENVRIST